jgi:pimeloyl-ACP methyl ester carboxylesterase
VAGRFVPSGPVTTSRRGSFWVGSQTVDGPAGRVLRGPLFVAWESPAPEVADAAAPPWVLIHGGGGQGTDYTTTPDGRPGWSRLLVAAGHTVYVVDRPGHGRSPHHPGVLGPMGDQIGDEVVRSIFTPDPDPAGGPAHTQWPGGRELGDPVFAQALAATGPMLADPADRHALERDRIGELLGMVGPAVVVTHSAGGPGTLAAVAAASDQVAALVAIEIVVPDAGPPPLPGLPVAVVTSETSRWNATDESLAAALRAGGATVELVRLAERGIHGNGHAMMLERNHAEVLGAITDWVAGALA